MKKGDIVLLPFPFTDLSGSKYRPAVALISFKADVTVAFISTNLNSKELTDIVLMPDPINGLKKESIIKVSKIATVSSNLVTGIIGNMSDSELQKLDHSLKVLLKLF